VSLLKLIALHGASCTRAIELQRRASQHNHAWIGAILQAILDAARASFSWDYVSDVTMPLSLGAC
jgi:hypothetical protein